MVQPAAPLGRRSLRLAGKLMLAQRLADIDSARGEKRIGHAAADDQMVDLGDEVTEHVELGRDLGAADHRRHWPLGIAERPLAAP